ncbi:hypothetical protein [Dactylococcopsis salina]|uniref:Uncharacterized protein n=1 Tax=Dactylococcopsis salina (strain PCC 8305) TaxID=13035 RepID=K9YU38_DACS8|nr:hypothetical protein [Dactylococcopsis salina]AFZ50409.1 hypothetical protein Dacsa_1745 [Dactylococcopsis salina PCC 8305]
MAEKVNQSKQTEVEIALSILSTPFLMGLIGARSMQQGLISIGEASEEIFRRDRLPVLHFQQENEIEIKD